MDSANAPTWMTREEALARVVADDSPYAIESVEVAGVTYPYFRHAPENLAAMFAGSLAFGDKPFLRYEQDLLSYRGVYEQASALARYLREELGVEKGDRVAIAMRNYPEWAISFMAATSIGAIAVALNGWWTGSELQFGLQDSGACVAVVDGERCERLAPLLDQLICRVIVTRPTGPLPQGVLDLAPILARPAAEMPRVHIAPDDDATILYTSGSTDTPKGAVSSHRAIIGAVMAFECGMVQRALMIVEEEDRRANLLRLLSSPEPPGGVPIVAYFPEQRLLVNVPFFHVTGSHTMLLPSYRVGRQLVLMRKWDANEAVRVIERERITHMIAVPTMTWELINCDEFARRDTSSLISLGGGGAARPPEHVKRIQASLKEGDASTGYGMTETNALGSAIAGADYLARPTSVGRAIAPLVEARIVGEDGSVLGPGETGEICLKTPTAIRGYWNRPEATRTTIVDGWIHTGDIGHMDSEGFLFITDRAKDIIIRGGENISCTEVEAALADHPAVFESAAYGVPDERLGERLQVTVMVRAGMQTTPEALQAHVKQRLAAFKVPERVRLTHDRLPRLASEKIDRRALRNAAIAEAKLRA